MEKRSSVAELPTLDTTQSPALSLVDLLLKVEDQQPSRKLLLLLFDSVREIWLSFFLFPFSLGGSLPSRRFENRLSPIFHLSNVYLCSGFGFCYEFL